jgi:diadenosine tetraphosphate (Ap4A) HIT family hydrolase
METGKKHQEIILETSCWKVVLIRRQLYLGRCVVVLKRSCGDLAELSQDEVLDFFDVVRALQDLLKKTFCAEMFNWSCLMNNAYQNNPADPQVHWHFRARYRHPVEFNGTTFRDPNFGHHAFHDDAYEVYVSDGMLSAIADKLRAGLK